MPVEDASPSLWRIVLIGRNPQFTLVRILLLVALCFLIPKYVVLPIRVTGISMMPTYKDRAIRVVNRLAYRSRAPQRGDVVAIRLTGEHVMLLKRVVGLPGETLEFIEGTLYIDGQPMVEPYVKFRCNWNIEPLKIGPGEYYVVGDNRSMYERDHTKGRVNMSKIVGKTL
jgi:signal peptidase I